MRTETDSPNFDVAICGGGLAGLTLARQLRMELPEVSVVLVDKQTRPLPAAAFKVGESTVEVGAHYLAEIVGLRDYLEERHLCKNGIRYFFGDPEGDFHLRPEYGLSQFPLVSSYQIDRGVLENDLRQMVSEAGVELLEGYSIRDIRLSNGRRRHELILEPQDETGPRSLRARWVVDATGRRRLLQRKLNLTRRVDSRCSGAWFRYEGRVDVDDLVSEDEVEWHARVPNRSRYFSTTHLMGAGYWVWLIPLGSGNTSVGIVADEALHPFSEFNTYESALDWLRRHEPSLAAYIGDRPPMDFLVMRKYSYASDQVFSTDRWACIGEAGQFSDPFYSPGTDLIGFGNCITTDMIRRDAAGSLKPAMVTRYDKFLRSLNDQLTEFIQLGYPVFGNAVVAAAKLLWDSAAAWGYVAPQMYDQLITKPQKSRKVREVTGRFVFLARRMQELFAEWNAVSPRRASYEFLDYLSIPFLNDFRLRNLRGGKTTEMLIRDHQQNMRVYEELAQALFLVAVEDVMPDQLSKFPESVWLNAWGISLDPERWEKDKLFEPATEPPEASTIRQQIRSQFRFE